MKKYISELSKLRLESLNGNEFIRSIVAEAKKYQLFKIGNKGSGKEIHFLRANKDNVTSYVSFTTFNGISCIILPKSTDLNNKKEKIILTHELAHCISDDTLFLIASNIKHLCLMLSILTIATSGISYISLCTLFLCLLLYKMQFWVKTHAEISANNTSMEILDTIEEKIEVHESSKVLWKIKQIGSDYLASKEKRSIKEIFELTSLKEQLRYLKLAKDNGTLINYLSPINIPIGAIIILIYSLALLNIENLSKYLSVSWPSIIGVLIAVVILQIIHVALLIKERRKKWTILNLIGRR